MEQYISHEIFALRCTRDYNYRVSKESNYFSPVGTAATICIHKIQCMCISFSLIAVGTTHVNIVLL